MRRRKAQNGCVLRLLKERAEEVKLQHLAALTVEIFTSYLKNSWTVETHEGL